MYPEKLINTKTDKKTNNMQYKIESLSSEAGAMRVLVESNGRQSSLHDDPNVKH